MRYFKYILSGFLICILCQGADLYLKSESTGRLYGPFEMRDREHIEIGKSSFTVVEKDVAPTTTKPPTLEQRLREIRLPDVDFRNASAEDGVDFLKSQLIQSHPDLGINIIVKRPKSFRAIDTDRADPFAAVSLPQVAVDRKVNLSELNATAYSVLEQIAEQAGFKIRISGRLITLVK